MNRRSFLKSLAALAGVASVPNIGFAFPASFPASIEPVEWTVQEFDYGRTIGVAAAWGDGVRNAVRIASYFKTQKEDIEICKKALRQWRLEKKCLS